MTLSLPHLIKTNPALTYIEDIVLQARNKAEMFKNLPNFHSLLRTAGLKASNDKKFFFLKKVNFLGHIISNKRMQFCQKGPRNKRLENSGKKRDVLRVIGSFGWYSHFIKNLRVIVQLMFELTHDGTPSHWTNEHEQAFTQMKEDISTETILAFLICVNLPISKWIHPMLEQAQSLSKSSQEERALFLSIRDFSIKLERN